MWYTLSATTVLLRIYAKPNARQSGITGISEQGLCISLKARPQEGEANTELIAFLAKFFHVTKKQVVLQRGEAARYKAVILPRNSHVEAFIRERLAGETTP